MTLTPRQAATLLSAEIVPVVGCTEPASIAFALGASRRQLGPSFDPASPRVELRLSRDVRRNASTAVIPFVRRRGLKAVAAAGLLCEDQGFNPFLGLDRRRREFVRLMRRRGWLKVTPLARRGLHLTVIVSSGPHRVEVTVSGRHNAITEMRCDRETVYQAQRKPLPRLRSLEEAARLARLRSPLLERIARDFLTSQVADDRAQPLSRQVPALIRGRMTGQSLPVVTFTGSGNQGLFLGLPLRRLYRRHGHAALPAVVFALLVQIHLTQKHARLSGACGIATKAAPALAAGLAFFQGASLTQIRSRMRQVTARLDTLQCPGALPSCGAKAATALEVLAPLP